MKINHQLKYLPLKMAIKIMLDGGVKIGKTGR